MACDHSTDELNAANQNLRASRGISEQRIASVHVRVRVLGVVPWFFATNRIDREVIAADLGYRPCVGDAADQKEQGL